MWTLRSAATTSGCETFVAQLLQLVFDHGHDVLDVVVELRRLVLVADARLADLVGEQAGEDRDGAIPPAITNAASQRPAKLSGE